MATEVGNNSLRKSLSNCQPVMAKTPITIGKTTAVLTVKMFGKCMISIQNCYEMTKAITRLHIGQTNQKVSHGPKLIAEVLSSKNATILNRLIFTRYVILLSKFSIELFIN